MRIAWALLLVLLAGCAAAPRPSAPMAAEGAAPSACEASPPGVAHHADGRPATWDGPLPQGCLLRTGSVSGEPLLGIAPKTSHVFFAPALAQGDRSVGVARSDDGGSTWRRVLPAVAGKGTHEFPQDTSFFLDPATGRLFLDDYTGSKCSVVSWSDDEGATWRDSASGCTQFDHQTLFSGKPVTSKPVGYPSVVYQCSLDVGATNVAGFSSGCEKTLDGGVTWIPTGAPAMLPTVGPGNIDEPVCNGELGHGASAPDGTLLLPNGLCGEAMLAISHDEGLTWSNVRVSDLGLAYDGVDYAHETAVGADPAGNFYYAWVAHDRLPRLTVSRDAGKTWSPPIDIAPPGLTEAALAEIAVGDVGRIAVVYMGSTNAPVAPFPMYDCAKDPVPCAKQSGPGYENATWNGYLVESIDALSPDPTFLTTTINPPSDPLVRGACGPIRCQQEYDFIDVRIAPDGSPWAALVDGCETSCTSGDLTTANRGEGIVGHLIGGPPLRS